MRTIITGIATLATTLGVTLLTGCAAPTSEEADPAAPVAKQENAATSKPSAAPSEAPAEPSESAPPASACSAAARGVADAAFQSALDLYAKSKKSKCALGQTRRDALAEAGLAVSYCASSAIEAFKHDSAAMDFMVSFSDNPLGSQWLYGRFEVRDASGKAAWTGLADALAGTTMFGAQPGPHAGTMKLVLGPKGSFLASESTFGGAVELQVQSTWKIGAVNADGTVAIETTTLPAYGNVTRHFTLSQDTADVNGKTGVPMPAFTLTDDQTHEKFLTDLPCTK